MTTEKLWLDLIPERLRANAVAALAAGEVERFLALADNIHGLHLVLKNLAALRGKGLFEKALLSAFTSTRTNHHGFPEDVLRTLFAIADRPRLRAAGQPLPGPGPFTLYRGVFGYGRARRIRGISWTSTIETARLFANQFKALDFHDRAVYTVTVAADEVLAYDNGRTEDEFFLLLPKTTRPQRVPNEPGDLIAAGAVDAMSAGPQAIPRDEQSRAGSGLAISLGFSDSGVAAVPEVSLPEGPQ